MLTDETLAALRRLHEAATPGPWRFTHEYADPATKLIYRYREESHLAIDDELVVAMRNALPDLLDDLERMRGINDAARERNKALMFENEELRKENATLRNALVASDKLACELGLKLKKAEEGFWEVD